MEDKKQEEIFLFFFLRADGKFRARLTTGLSNKLPPPFHERPHDKGGASGESLHQNTGLSELSCAQPSFADCCEDAGSCAPCSFKHQMHAFRTNNLHENFFMYIFYGAATPLWNTDFYPEYHSAMFFRLRLIFNFCTATASQGACVEWTAFHNRGQAHYWFLSAPSVV